MMKAVKLVLGLIVLSGLGLIYGKFNKAVDEIKEGSSFVYISFSYPGDAVTSVLVKKTPRSQCEQWRSDYFNAANEQCVGCTIIANDCRETIPEKYQKALNKEDIGSVYFYRPHKYPEVTVYEGNLPSDAFTKLCEIEKENLDTAQCFE